MDPFSRRNMLSFSAAGAVATVASVANATTFGNPDSPAQGAVNANAGALRDPGPRNPALASQFLNANNPPATDIGELPLFWASFNNAHKRIQAGGWERQVTQADFAISDSFSGVNMRLGAGGILEMHWHLASEWAYMTNGHCRITVLDQKGRAYVQDVEEGDLWFFPAGMPHSLEGIGANGCEFLIAFDDGKASEFNTLLMTDWMAHMPPEVLAMNFGVPADTFKSIPLDDLWIFQGKEPGPLAADQRAVAAGGAPPFPFTFKMGDSTPVKSNRSGTIQVVDSTTFKAGPNVQTQDFRAGDVGYIPRNQGHYLQNTWTTDLQVLALFRAPEYQEISLSEWLVRTPPALVAQHFNIDPPVLAKFPQNAPGILPA